MKSLEEALVAEWCPTEDGDGLVSIMGLLLQRLEACAPANEDGSPACPLQVGTPAASYSLAHMSWAWSLACGHFIEARQLTAPLSSLTRSKTRLLDVDSD